MLIRVLEIPKSSGEFCFGGGNPQTWIEVDWFRDDLPPDMPDAPTMATEEGRQMLVEFVKQKRYFDKNKSYLLLHPEHSVTINYEAA